MNSSEAFAWTVLIVWGLFLIGLVVIYWRTHDQRQD